MEKQIICSERQLKLTFTKTECDHLHALIEALHSKADQHPKETCEYKELMFLSNIFREFALDEK